MGAEPRVSDLERHGAYRVAVERNRKLQEQLDPFDDVDPEDEEAMAIQEKLWSLESDLYQLQESWRLS